jgi:DnaK suppressor protein
MSLRRVKSDDAVSLNPESFPVAEGEDPWTAEELAEVRAELLDERERMRRSLGVAEAGLQDLLSDSDSASGDSADIGSTHFERNQEMSLAANAREMLDQVVLALHLIDTGTYGSCEICGRPIGKGRLQVFPRATMCVACKQREERR